MSRDSMTMTQVRGGTRRVFFFFFFFNQIVATITMFSWGILAGWVKAVRKSGKKVRMGECDVPAVPCKFQVRVQP